MQREIKFRAWNKYTGMMEVMSIGDGRTLGYPLTEKSHVSCFYDEDHGAYSTWSGYSDERRTMDGSKSDCILMQFTGLKDKNGKDVYESDIIRFSLPQSYMGEDGEWNEKPDYTGTGTMIFEDSMWKISGGPMACNLPLNNFEIIGNIYENPELLK